MGLGWSRHRSALITGDSCRQFIRRSTITLKSTITMPHPSIPALMILSATLPGTGAPQANVAGGADRVEYAQLSFHQRIVIRVPRLPDPRDADAAANRSDRKQWAEKKGPKCVAIPMISGASVTRNDSVDLVTVDSAVLRARFYDNCPALDFYNGFYMRQTADGMVCANRDSLRSRSGGTCRIKTFRLLVHKR
jgi:hypothetical protein